MFSQASEVFWPQQEVGWKMQCSSVSQRLIHSLEPTLLFKSSFSLQGRRWTVAFCPPLLKALEVFSHLPFVISLSAFNGCLTLGRYSQQALNL